MEPKLLSFGPGMFLALCVSLCGRGGTDPTDPKRGTCAGIGFFCGAGGGGPRIREVPREDLGGLDMPKLGGLITQSDPDERPLGDRATGGGNLPETMTLEEPFKFRPETGLWTAGEGDRSRASLSLVYIVLGGEGPVLGEEGNRVTAADLDEDLGIFAAGETVDAPIGVLIGVPIGVGGPLPSCNAYWA